MWYLSGMDTDEFLAEARVKKQWDTRINHFLDMIHGLLQDLNIAASSMEDNHFKDHAKQLIEQYHVINKATKEIERIQKSQKVFAARYAK